MLDFKPITLEAREKVLPLLQLADSISCDASFGNHFAWSHIYGTQYAMFNGYYCIRSAAEPGFYTMPLGRGDFGAAVRELERDARERGQPLYLRGLLEEDRRKVDELFPEKFDIEEVRDEADYIYSVEALTNLTGKKYAGKRNHISRFLDNPDWAYEDITEQNLDECYEMNEEWCRQNGCRGAEDLSWEHCAVRKFLKFFRELELAGGLLRREGKVVAFTLGEPLSQVTYNIHVEKAFSDIQGAYPMINRQFLLHHCQGYRYVNREEDLGAEGLRKAKLSYHPEILLMKYTAKLKEGVRL